MYLESKLGYAGGKGKKKADDDDGLDGTFSELSVVNKSYSLL